MHKLSTQDVMNVSGGVGYAGRVIDMKPEDVIVWATAGLSAYAAGAYVWANANTLVGATVAAKTTALVGTTANVALTGVAGIAAFAAGATVAHVFNQQVVSRVA